MQKHGHWLIYFAAGALLFISASAEKTTIESASSLPIKADAESGICKYLIKFDVSSIPEDATVDMALVHATIDLDTTVSTPLNVVAYPVTETWVSSETPSIGVPVSYVDSMIYPAFFSDKTGQELEILLTELVQAWVSGELPNHGIIVMGLEHPESAINIYTGKLGVTAELFVSYTDSNTEK